jgi:hypothetical protein
MPLDEVTATLRCNEFELRLRLHENAVRDPQKRDDPIRVGVDFESHNFHGSTHVLVDVDDFSRFLPALREAYVRLEGLARFSTVEPGVELHFEFMPRGRVVVRGTVQQDLGNSLSVHVHGHCDQTDIDRFIHDLARAGF